MATTSIEGAGSTTASGLTAVALVLLGLAPLVHANAAELSDVSMWVPSLSTAGLVAAAVYLFRKLIVTRLAKGVQHEYDAKLESLKRDIRASERALEALVRRSEQEASDLRDAAMKALASRSAALDQRRLQAVDELWTATGKLSKAKAAVTYAGLMKFENMAKAAQEDAKMREFAAALLSGVDKKSADPMHGWVARPFVTDECWAVYNAYATVIVYSITRIEIVRLGASADVIADPRKVGALIKAVLPHQTDYVDEHGVGGFVYLIDELELALLKELRKSITGTTGDAIAVDNAAEIIRRSNEVQASLAVQSGTQSANG